ncbi:regulator of chromosome condensation (RCC1) repeat domain-containing protein [Sarocladium implicatum]|nr:regulator of chromosome condensation (RCC1) repeat domain-containing protein [Sarocladium implicatum]
MAPKAKATGAAKAATKKAAAPAAKPSTNGASKKRKAEEVDEYDIENVEPTPKANGRQIKKTKTAPVPAAKKARTPEPKAAAKPEPKPASPEKPKKTHVDTGKKINSAPTQVLDVYVFGEGTSGELGLGSRRINGKKPVDVKRPRLNDNLSASATGVVQIACGGMHAIALTKDNKILTWGVNDQGALGRDTKWSGGLRDMNAEDSDSEDEDDTGMNPVESTPGEVSAESFAPGVKFVQVTACDSASFVLTEDGRVYGWGTFRSSDGILGFDEHVKVQATPVLLPVLKNVKSLAAGSNHVLALDHKGNVLAWGCGQQNQLGRRIIERNKMSSLVPQGLGLPRGKIVQIACGSYHSFAIDKEGSVWAWGLNNFGELGIESNAGEDDAVVLRPVKVEGLEGKNIADIDGGEHHSLACSDKGELYTWGRVDGYQVGFEFDSLSTDNTIYDDRGQARILFKPTAHTSVSNIASVAAGTDNSFAVTKDGKVYSWGFSSNYQTGQGTIDDIKVPTLIDNTAIRGKMITGAGAGGQYSVLTGIAEDVKVNGA